MMLNDSGAFGGLRFFHYTQGIYSSGMHDKDNGLGRTTHHLFIYFIWILGSNLHLIEIVHLFEKKKHI